MQILINLPDTNITEDIIRAAKWENGSLFDLVLRGAMKDAIILPKGHGDLIDRNDLKYEKYNSYAYAIANAPTIIEADKE